MTVWSVPYSSPPLLWPQIVLTITKPYQRPHRPFCRLFPFHPQFRSHLAHLIFSAAFYCGLHTAPRTAMSTKASGADSRSNGDAKNRTHHDGSSGRAFTVEQKAAVMRIKRCSPTAFYEILGLEEVKTTCSEGEIKKAYRKLSLLTHPDKNGYDGADEAFKRRSP